MYNPISTYRIQFNKDFTLKDLQEQAEYLSMLGIGTIYSSPIFKAAPGSAHGYDTTDPLVFNPEITNFDEFISTGDFLSKKGIGWLQDIVSNHMAYHPENSWIMDVLEKGQDSEFHKVFDLEPGVPSMENRLMVPFLGESPAEALNNKNIKLGWKNGNFCVSYFDNTYPVNFLSFKNIMENELADAPDSFISIWQDHKLNNSKADKQFLNTNWEISKQLLQDLYEKEADFFAFIENIISNFNAHDNLIKKVLAWQNYELCFWMETERRINFRRFFTVNGLICLRMEDKEVFDYYHTLIKQMVDKGYFQGLRIDHIDGLKDPNTYLKRLRKLTGDECYIIAEKILEYEEEMPEFWPIQGNTGYDFLATVNNVFTSSRNYEKLRKIYKAVTHVTENPADLVYQNKKMILTTRMHGEWDNLVNYFIELGFIDYQNDDIGNEEIKEAIGEFMLACPVYRLYPRQFPLRNNNRKTVEEIFETAVKRNPALKRGLDKLSEILLAEEDTYERFSGKPELFFSRLMQFTGPLMAKGVEDTSMYQYNCFIAHNEVGDAINARGISNEEYHKQMHLKLEKWPYTMNTTSTHDTKRGEDVRARLNVISVLTEEWEEHVFRWIQMNQKLKIRLDQGVLEPSMSVEYFVYQTLLGTFPFSGEADEEYLQRIDEYLVKALREAKRKVSWRDPDETYEDTVCEFTRKMLDPQHEFLESFIPFQQKIAWRGVVNSLSQLALKCTSPGIPDIYQGTELWDLTLVDPDNRQPVDYKLRHQMLKGLIAENKKNSGKMIRSLLGNPFDGRIKLWLTFVLLNERRNNPELFVEGDYIPLQIKGKLSGNVLAFARKHKQDWFITSIPLLTQDFSPKHKGEFIQDILWENTSIGLPEGAPQKWQNILSGAEIDSRKGILISDLFNITTIGLLKAI